MSELFIIALIILNTYIFISLKKEKRRLQILTSFVGGLMQFSSKIPAVIDEAINKKGGRSDDVDGYRIILEDISSIFEKDFWENPYEKFIKHDRNLFWEQKLYNAGFNQIFLDFYDKSLKEWYAAKHGNPNDLDLKNNEELGEKLIYQDILAGKAKEIQIPKNPELFFRHLSEEEVGEIKRKIQS